MTTTTFKTQQKPNRNSLLELVKLAFAFMVLKGHGFTPLAVWANEAKDACWFGSAGMAVEFFFCVAGWFLIKGIVRHQEKYEHLGMWRSWWKLFIKKMVSYAIPCLIPGLAVTIITTFFDGGCPNGILWMYYFVHELLLVTFLYYVIFFKIKDEHKRFLANLWLMIIGLVVRFAFRTLTLVNGTNLETLFEFWRALSYMSIGAMCARIPKINAKKWILWIICILSIASCMTLVTVPIRDIWKEIGTIVCYPLIIYGCLLVNFVFKPFDYLGSLSKGLYLWQTVPWMFDVIGKSRGVEFLANKWFLMSIAIALPIIEDTIRKIVKYAKSKSFDQAAYNLKIQNREKWWTNTYLNKQYHFVLLIVIACCLMGFALSYGLYGLSVGHFKSFDWFLQDDKITTNCAIVLTCVWLTPFPVLFAVNWKLQHNALVREQKHIVK